MHQGPYQRFGSFPFCVFMLACFYALSSMLASLVLGFTRLDAFSRFVVVRLHLTPLRPCLDINIWDASPWCQLLRAYLSPFLLRAMICLPCLFMPPIGFLCIFTRLLTCPCISLACWCVAHASTQCSYGPPIQTYICPLRTPPFVWFFACLPFCLFDCFIASLLAIPIMLIRFMPFHMLFALFPSIACLLVSCLRLCMNT